ncbi:MAG: phage baseplate assembly protein [Bdellovibrionota bacterium]
MLAKFLRGMIFIGVLEAVNDSTGVQEIQVKGLAGEVLSKVLRYQQFGFSSNPPAGSEVVVIRLGLDGEITIALGADHRASRVRNLASGESAQYGQAGQKVLCDAAGNIHLYPAGSGKVISHGDLEVQGDVTASGDVSDGAGTMAQIRTTHSLHTHPENASPTYTQNATTGVPNP